MQLTFIGLNSWLLEIANLKILIDPWLVDSLILYGLPWLFEAQHQQPPCYTPETLPPIDLILISQGLDDHCHQPTLQQLSRQIPVVASPSAAKTLRRLGFKHITSLSPWQTYTLSDMVEIIATPGARIQGQLENGFVLRSRSHPSESLYYEPHLATDSGTLERVGQMKVKIAIAPAVGQIFPLLGKVIMNPQDALHLVRSLQPKYFLPTAVGDISTTGILPQLTRTDGTIDEFAKLLTHSRIPTELVTLSPGQTFAVNN